MTVVINYIRFLILSFRLIGFRHSILEAAYCIGYLTLKETFSLLSLGGFQQIPVQRFRSYSEILNFKVQCSETTLTGESRFHISPPRGFESESLVAGSKQVVHWTSETWWESCEIAGSRQGFPPSSWLCRLWSQKGDLLQAWNRDRKAVWSSRSRLTHCRRGA